MTNGDAVEAGRAKSEMARREETEHRLVLRKKRMSNEPIDTEDNERLRRLEAAALRERNLAYEAWVAR